MAWASITYTFSPSTTIKSADVNTNFSNVVVGLNTAAPSGIIAMWSGAIGAVPTGWYLCDGTNGTPDLRGRFIVAAGQGAGLTNRVVGAIGGEEAHTLTTSEIPGHTHNVTTGIESNGHVHYDSGHWHPTNVRNGSTSNGYVSIMGASNGPTNTINNSTGACTPSNAVIGDRSAAHTHSGTTDSGTVSGGSHNNMPPFYALAFIMKS